MCNTQIRKRHGWDSYSGLQSPSPPSHRSDHRPRPHLYWDACHSQCWETPGRPVRCSGTCVGRQFIDPRTQRAGPWKTRTRLGMERPNPGNRTPPRLGRQVTRKARWISRPSLQSERTTPAHTCSKLSSSANDRQARPWAVGGGNHSHTPDLKAQASAVSARWGEVVSVTVIQGLV